MLIASFQNPVSAAAFCARLGATRTSETIVVCRPDSWTTGPEPLLACQGSIVDRRRRRVLTIEEIAAALVADGGAALADWAPPFRLAWRDGDAVTVAADATGLAQWSAWQGPGVAAIASTATEIARCFGLAVDTTALGGLALIGNLVGDATVVTGVSLVPAGHAATLVRGHLSKLLLPTPSLLSDPDDALTAATTRLLDAHGDAAIELTGGWDSRMLLAAIPRERRAGLKGFTLGNSRSPDVVIAAQLARDSGMHHDIVDLSQLPGLDADTIAGLIADAAVRDDYGSNPLDRALINAVNGGRSAQPRFSGQNGEILRGFYYPGQPIAGRPSLKLAQRVIDWRIIANDRVAADLFAPGAFADMRWAVTSRIAALLAGEGSWGEILDRFYLEQRMRRWCGTSVSAALGQRPLLLPFFDADVIALARTVPAAEKVGSRFAARLITRLDPALARIALESGLRPVDIATSGIVVRLRHAQRFADKAAAKVYQRVSKRNQTTLGSRNTLGLAVQHNLFGRLDVHRLSRLGIFSPMTLEAIASGRTVPSSATGGFLLNCDRLLASLEDA